MQLIYFLKNYIGPNFKCLLNYWLSLEVQPHFLFPFWIPVSDSQWYNTCMLMQVSWFFFHWSEIVPLPPQHVLYSFISKQCTLTAYLSLLRPWSQGVANLTVVNKVTHVSVNYFLFPLTGSGIHYLLNTILTVLFSKVGSWTVLLLLGCSQWCFHLSWERKKLESIVNVFLLNFSMSITAVAFTE